MTPEEMAAKIQRLPWTALNVVGQEMAVAVLAVEKKAKENCTPQTTPYSRAPFDTGRLRGSIQGRVETTIQIGGGGEIRGLVGAYTNYAIHVHEGTSRMQARPFILDAIEAEEENTLRIIEQALISGLRSECV